LLSPAFVGILEVAISTNSHIPLRAIVPCSIQTKTYIRN
jgi:hypothetical protein